MATHYDTLGVKRGCNPSEIKSSYRKIVLAHHPDRSDDPKSAAIFMQATEAYEVLGDVERRREYDRFLYLEDQKRAQLQASMRATPQPKPKAAPRPQVSVAVELTRLVQLFSRGRLAEAEGLADDLMRREPREAIPYGVKADILRARGNLVEAARMYAFAAQFDPRNPVYQRRHEELIASAQVTTSTIHVARDKEAKTGPLIFAAIFALAGGIYIAAAPETPLLPGTPLVSAFTLGSLMVLFLTGLVAGASLAMGGWLDRHDATAFTALGRHTPTFVLGFVALVNFWAAALLYVFIGLGQRGFNYSTSRVVGSVAGMTLLFSLCAFASESLSSMQVLAWGGNLSYLGALLGWIVADAFRS